VLVVNPGLADKKYWGGRPATSIARPNIFYAPQLSSIFLLG
jgi:hypothetical protein